VPTESGFSAYRPVEDATATTALRGVVDRVGAPVAFHCCANGLPVELFVAAGAAALSLDPDQVVGFDPLGEALDAGVALLAGVAPATGERPPPSKELAARVRRTWDELGFPADRLAAQVVVTPACGLAGATPAYARGVLTACREAGQRLREE
jgi:methionine synthase II (cobalamin-independent)